MLKACNDISGLLLLDKPFGITSFKLTHSVEKMLNVKKAGHCGTLDPSATGLLLVLVGKATSLQSKFVKKDKIYTSSFLLGTVTDSGDLEGNVIARNSIANIDIEEIKKIAKTFEGEILQIPPMYSALKCGGKRLYELARQGIVVERKPRKITIDKFEIFSYDAGIVNVKISCSSGTYVRALAQDLGTVLKCGATVRSLRREKIGVFDVKDALKFEDLRDVSKMMKSLIPMDSLI